MGKWGVKHALVNGSVIEPTLVEANGKELPLQGRIANDRIEAQD